MIPAPFDYEVAESVEHALSLLQERDDAKLLAGGHSLLPLLKLRITRPALLVDIGAENGIIEKSGAWYSYNGQKIGQGRENAKMFLRDNPAIMLEVEEKVKVILGVGPKAEAGDSDSEEG